MVAFQNAPDSSTCGGLIAHSAKYGICCGQTHLATVEYRDHAVVHRYERMYLHVDLNDPAATTLYGSMGYESMEQYDAPMWMRKLFGLPTIRYQVKNFKKRKSESVETTEESGRQEAVRLR